jgi:hypothetical protein
LDDAIIHESRSFRAVQYEHRSVATKEEKGGSLGSHLVEEA